MIRVKNNIASREPLPHFLVGLEPESLADLSWTDPALGVLGLVWWPEEDASRPLGEYQRYGAENLTVDPKRRVVISLRRIELWSEDEIAAANAEKVSRHREDAKRLRQDYVNAIKVKTQSGNTFDGDETSQTRMARAIIALQATSSKSVKWVLSDNSVIEATAAELSEALSLASAAQAARWLIE